MTRARACAESLRAIAERAPRIHCISNAVAMTYSANVLLCVGATPSMSFAPEEVAQFVAKADSLCINLGTLDEPRRRAIDIAIASAAEHRIPWVLDPVFVDTSTERLRYARSLLERGPAVVRGNGAEIAALTGRSGPDAARHLAIRAGIAVTLSGPTDFVASARQLVSVSNGHPLMARVTAVGCAASALAAAFLAVEPDPFAAAVQATLALAVAGELAGELAAGPGSFQTQLLDQLYALDDESLRKRARVAQVNPGGE